MVTVGGVFVNNTQVAADLGVCPVFVIYVGVVIVAVVVVGAAAAGGGDAATIVADDFSRRATVCAGFAGFVVFVDVDLRCFQMVDEKYLSSRLLFSV